jgi:3-methylcrotonyl-CoA carboxylase alpha subunit
MFRRLLIANRGEIACRIARTARRLGLTIIAVYSEADAGARHVRLADEAYPIGPADARASYLNIERILAVARAARADAVHPGYGFLSENAEFAAACAAAGVAFVGPPARAIAAMGSKAAAKLNMQRASVPVLPGYAGEEQTLAVLERRGRELGFPLIIKPSGGGGGKGMQIVETAEQLPAALEAARRIAASAFGDARLLLERYLPAPRHIEVQVLADQHARVLHLFDRDCSVQRRHQKLIEEAPAPGIDDEVRARLAAAACTVAGEIAYVGAGTVEFLLEGREFFFMEMNTRLQVEHPVTEAITGLDLVEWQLRIAAGEPLPIEQGALAVRGHAVEVRVCAEDPVRDFLPGAGRILLADWPQHAPGVRVDFGFESGDAVPSNYDSLLGKIIAHAPTRTEAVARLKAALRATQLAGVPTNTQWLASALEQPEFADQVPDTGFVLRHQQALRPSTDPEPLLPFAAAAAFWALQGADPPQSPWQLADGFRIGESASLELSVRAAGQDWITRTREVGDSSVAVVVDRHADLTHRVLLESRPAAAASSYFQLRLQAGGPRALVLVHDATLHVWCAGVHQLFERQSADAGALAEPLAAGNLTAVLPGVVVSVLVAKGQAVEAGQPLLVVEAMKMEHTIRAPEAGVVKSVKYKVGERVKEGSPLVELEPPAAVGTKASS